MTETTSACLTGGKPSPITMNVSDHSAFRLERFNGRWGEPVLGWITSRQELRNWSARADYPLTEARVFDEWHADPDVAPFVLLMENVPVAYGEIWFDESDGSAELGRLVVSPSHRGQGLGRMFVERLAAIAYDAGYQQIWVRVFPTNAAALRCYESTGFSRVADDEEAVLNAAQRFQFTWMVRLKSESPLVRSGFEAHHSNLSEETHDASRVHSRIRDLHP